MLGFLVLWIPTVALPHFLRSNSSLDILHVTEGSSFEHLCLILILLVIVLCHLLVLAIT
jgi:hypothetical protein